MAETAKASQDIRLMAALIPSSVTKSEAVDRLNFARAKLQQAASAPNPTIAAGYIGVAKAALSALPRDEVARRHAELQSKADAMPPGPHRDELHRQA